MSNAWIALECPCIPPPRNPLGMPNPKPRFVEQTTWMRSGYSNLREGHAAAAAAQPWIDLPHKAAKVHCVMPKALSYGVGWGQTPPPSPAWSPRLR